MLEKYDENFKLAKLWATQGLLCLSDSGVFNNFKSETTDRQIGYRRCMNAAERSARGPSRHLLAGYMMTSLYCQKGHSLLGVVTRARAKSNSLPFAYEAEVFRGDDAWNELLEEIAARKGSRDKVGDRYSVKQRSVLVAEPAEVYPCFASLFQVDHLGIEFALSSHGSFLQKKGFLTATT